MYINFLLVRNYSLQGNSLKVPDFSLFSEFYALQECHKGRTDLENRQSWVTIHRQSQCTYNLETDQWVDHKWSHLFYLLSSLHTVGMQCMLDSLMAAMKCLSTMVFWINIVLFWSMCPKRDSGWVVFCLFVCFCHSRKNYEDLSSLCIPQLF